MGSKNKKSFFAIIFFRFLIIIIFLGTIGYFAYDRTFDSIKNSDFFAIKDIWYESSLKAIDKSELSSLKGKSLLTIDLKKIQRQLQTRYPQYKNLRVLRRFPDQILVSAYRRYVVAQVKAGNGTFFVDENATILSQLKAVDQKLPVITGISFGKKGLSANNAASNYQMQVALKIIKEFQKDKALSNCPILRIDVSHLSEIHVDILEGLPVLFDRDNVEQKVKILSLVLTQAKVDPMTVRYIDLRFKEPILGTTELEKKNDR